MVGVSGGSRSSTPGCAPARMHGAAIMHQPRAVLKITPLALVAAPQGVSLSHNCATVKPPGLHASCGPGCMGTACWPAAPVLASLNAPATCCRRLTALLMLCLTGSLCTALHCSAQHTMYSTARCEHRLYNAFMHLQHACMHLHTHAHVCVAMARIYLRPRQHASAGTTWGRWSHPQRHSDVPGPKVLPAGASHAFWPQKWAHKRSTCMACMCMLVYDRQHCWPGSLAAKWAWHSRPAGHGWHCAG
jgi:hypothetical protein